MSRSLLGLQSHRAMANGQSLHWKLFGPCASKHLCWLVPAHTQQPATSSQSKYAHASTAQEDAFKKWHVQALHIHHIPMQSKHPNAYMHACDMVSHAQTKVMLMHGAGEHIDSGGELSISSTHFSEEPRIATTWGLCSRTLPLPPKKKKTTARIPTQRKRMISSVNQEDCLGFPHIRATSTWTSGQTLNFSSLPAISCQIRTPCLIDLFSQQHPEETNLAPGPATWLHIADMTHLNKGAARPIKLTKPLSTCQIMRMCPNWPILKNVLEFQGYFKKRTFPKKALQRPQKDTFMCTIGRSRQFCRWIFQHHGWSGIAMWGKLSHVGVCQNLLSSMLVGFSHP